MKVSIFYSWQSDTRAAANRTFIQEALEAAAKDLRADESISVEPVVDRDTNAVPGAPDIGSTILEKIDASVAIVADVTIVSGRGSGRPAPNPNVLIELGYALKSLGPRRVILVQNVAFGGPEDLPFDLRQKRVLKYDSAPEANDRASERRKLQSTIKDALALVLTEVSGSPRTQYPVQLGIGYIKKAIRSERHDYQLQVTLTNQGTKPITEWHVDLVMPTRILEAGMNSLSVRERSDENETLFRSTERHHRDPIYPNDTKLVMTVDYYVDNEIFRKRAGLFNRTVSAEAYVHGELAATAKRSMNDLQIF